MPHLDYTITLGNLLTVLIPLLLGVAAFWRGYFRREVHEEVTADKLAEFTKAHVAKHEELSERLDGIAAEAGTKYDALSGRLDREFVSHKSLELILSGMNQSIQNVSADVKMILQRMLGNRSD